jgi:hypothetical protein
MSHAAGRQRGSRARHRRAIGGIVGVLAASLVFPGTVAATDSSAPDTSIVSAGRQLTPAEVRGFDITDSKAGAKALADAADSLDINRRPYRAFDFAGQQVVIDAKTPITVAVGLNAAGDKVYEVAPTAVPIGLAAQPGYAVPPASAWSYNTDGGFTTILGTWKQTVFWIIDVAWNWKPCGSCTAHQYFRIYGKMQAAVLTGSNPDEGYRRAWIEFDNNGAWGGSPYEFELPEPTEAHRGTDGITRTFGFGNNYDISFNVAPVTLGGGSNYTYGGSVTRYIEYWWPVVRSEIASGGVQYCRYDQKEFLGPKVIATQVGIRQAINAQLGGWNILKGMEQSTSRCPPQEEL